MKLGKGKFWLNIREKHPNSEEYPAVEQSPQGKGGSPIAWDS